MNKKRLQEIFEERLAEKPKRRLGEASHEEEDAQWARELLAATGGGTDEKRRNKSSRKVQKQPLLMKPLQPAAGEPEKSRDIKGTHGVGGRGVPDKKPKRKAKLGGLGLASKMKPKSTGKPTSDKPPGKGVFGGDKGVKGAEKPGDLSSFKQDVSKAADTKAPKGGPEARTRAASQWIPKSETIRVPDFEREAKAVGLAYRAVKELMKQVYAGNDYQSAFITMGDQGGIAASNGTSSIKGMFYWDDQDKSDDKKHGTWKSVEQETGNDEEAE